MSTTVYPIALDFKSTSISFRMMTPRDAKAMLKFSSTLPESDLIYLRTDITHPEIVAEWCRNIKDGHSITLLAEEDNQIIGYASLHLSPLSFTRHIGEVRVLVNTQVRGLGVGRSLVDQLYALAREKDLAKIIVQIPRNQPRVRNMFEESGFESQAILPDWLKDRHNRPHDLLIMSRNIIRD